MKPFIRTLFVTLITFAGFVAARDNGPEPSAATQTEILALREKAWRAWFGNDVQSFRQVVPAELVAMGWDGGPWENRDDSLRSMAEFAASGRRLQSLNFPRNVFQQYGNAVILYTTFRLSLIDRDGKSHDVSGRGTEVFVRRGGSWIHTGWHLDLVQ